MYSWLFANVVKFLTKDNMIRKHAESNKVAHEEMMSILFSIRGPERTAYCSHLNTETLNLNRLKDHWITWGFHPHRLGHVPKIAPIFYQIIKFQYSLAPEYLEVIASALSDCRIQLNDLYLTIRDDIAFPVSIRTINTTGYTPIFICL